jgi:hypothetical protein
VSEDEFFTYGGEDQDREEVRAFAMACATLGVPLRQPRSFIDRASVSPHGVMQRRLAWMLESRSPDGKWITAEMRTQWESDQWRADNPWHPLTLLWQFAQNLRAAAAHEKTCEEIVISRGQWKVTVPRNWPREKILEAIKKLERKTQ